MLPSKCCFTCFLSVSVPRDAWKHPKICLVAQSSLVSVQLHRYATNARHGGHQENWCRRTKFNMLWSQGAEKHPRHCTCHHALSDHLICFSCFFVCFVRKAWSSLQHAFTGTKSVCAWFVKCILNSILFMFLFIEIKRNQDNQNMN